MPFIIGELGPILKRLLEVLENLGRRGQVETIQAETL